VALAVVVMGPPGAGKGTQASRIARERGIAHIATGEMLRTAKEAGTELGGQVADVMARGELVPDDLMIDLIRTRLAEPDAREGFILDGFPRTLAQAEALDAMLADVDEPLDAVLVFDLPVDVLVDRISGRRVCRANERHVYHERFQPPLQPGVCDVDGAPLYQRDDDRPDTVRRRYRLQWESAAPEVLEYYADRGLTRLVDASRPMGDVAGSVDRELDRLVRA
jgi:adenylate kinase